MCRPELKTRGQASTCSLGQRYLSLLKRTNTFSKREKEREREREREKKKERKREKEREREREREREGGGGERERECNQLYLLVKTSTGILGLPDFINTVRKSKQQIKETDKAKIASLMNKTIPSPYLYILPKQFTQSISNREKDNLL